MHSSVLGVRVFVGIFFCCFGWSTSQSNHCISKQTCSECIQAPDCAWCYQFAPVTGRASRNNSHCDLRQNMNTCRSLIDYQAKQSIVRDDPFSEANEIVQLRPQEISVTNLRRGEAVNITIHYSRARYYPIDLYYLMDVSNSMEDDKNKIVDLAGLLTETMKNVTSDLRLGFGSFLDKNTAPFVVWEDLPCYSDPNQKGMIISFKNNMQLGSNVSQFKEEVKKANIVRICGLPEGGFDGLLQVIVCKEKIGWRDDSRRVVIYATDDVSHMANNGKLGGVVTPNDGKCHLSDSGEYTDALKQDYPSLGQIGKLAQQNFITVIFAVTSGVRRVYENFTSIIVGSSVGELSADSSNLVDLVAGKFKELASTVELRHNASNDINIKMYTSCDSSLVEEKSKCTGLNEGSVVNFTVSIELKTCSQNAGPVQHKFKIHPIGLGESISIDLEAVCECSCEKPGNPGYVENATNCNQHGDFVCGKCQCHDEYSGSQCECLGPTSSIDRKDQCRANNETQIICSNSGSCVCGKCECWKRPDPQEEITGEFCECDNFDCPQNEGKRCSGNGNCVCGKCVCLHGWNGTSCECPMSNQSCTPDGSAEVCFGNGHCVCGKCQCQEGSTGTYCENCQTCPNKCDEFENCVKCKIFKNGPLADELCEKNCSYSIIAQPEVAVEDASEKYCSYDDENGCLVNFVYGFTGNGEKKVRVAEKPVCGETQDPVLIAGSLIGAIVFSMVVAVLLWKIITYVYDSRQYARFLEETKNAKWSNVQNPVYTPAISTFKNPTYNLPSD